MVQAADRVVEDYLERLERELADVPRARRRELLEEIEEHIAAARSESADAGEAGVRTLLERLGEPDEIAAEARERFGVPAPAPARRAGLVEVGAVIMLPVGGLVLPFVGWVIGVVLLWLSNAWNLRDKLIGTFVLPGGLLFPVFLLMIGASTAVGEEPCRTQHLDPIPATGPVGGATVKPCVEGPSALTEAIGTGVVTLAFALPVLSAVYLAVRVRRAR